PRHARKNMDLISIYHSHPDAPIAPSKLDLDYALPSLTCIVISLQAEEASRHSSSVSEPRGYGLRTR
ncbi:MAG TPA: Mov34/MPN/PAD-1 family protein, partial [Candidatus Dormibacteraeota bacterium]|nr:Mov34/MPN/PAD-1 family protein [Candidatus Dormibacteraeota bacterium]